MGKTNGKQRGGVVSGCFTYCFRKTIPPKKRRGEFQSFLVVSHIVSAKQIHPVGETLRVSKTLRVWLRVGSVKML